MLRRRSVTVQNTMAHCVFVEGMQACYTSFVLPSVFSVYSGVVNDQSNVPLLSADWGQGFFPSTDRSLITL